MGPALVDCPACSTSVSRSAPQCPKCGHPVREDLGRGAVMRRSDGSGAAAASDTMGLVGMICGVLGIGIAFIPFEFSWIAIVFSLLAIVLSSVALSRVSRGVASGRGMAVTGLITGILGVVLLFYAVFYLYQVLASEA